VKNPGGEMTTVKDIMSSPAVVISGEDTLLNAAHVMTEKGIGCLVVETGTAEIGIITERDFLKFVVNDRRDVMEVHVKEIMTSPALTIMPDESIYEASKMMQERKFRRLPVVENGKLIGIVTLTDLNEALRLDTIRALRVKLDELEMINKSTIDRESKIFELKKELEQLQKGEDPTKV